MQNNCLITSKKYRSSHRRCAIKKVLLKNQQIQFHRKTPLLESLFNSEYCKIFKSNYFKEHLRTAASENVHEAKKKRLLTRNFYIYIKETSENVCFYFMKETSENACFYFMIGFLWSCFHIEYFCDVVRNKLQTINIYLS